jgi:hypothetical protein
MKFKAFVQRHEYAVFRDKEHRWTDVVYVTEVSCKTQLSKALFYCYLVVMNSFYFLNRFAFGRGKACARKLKTCGVRCITTVKRYYSIRACEVRQQSVDGLLLLGRRIQHIVYLLVHRYTHNMNAYTVLFEHLLLIVDGWCRVLSEYALFLSLLHIFLISWVPAVGKAIEKLCYTLITMRWLSLVHVHYRVCLRVRALIRNSLA